MDLDHKYIVRVHTFDGDIILDLVPDDPELDLVDPLPWEDPDDPLLRGRSADPDFLPEVEDPFPPEVDDPDRDPIFFWYRSNRLIIICCCF